MSSGDFRFVGRRDTVSSRDYLPKEVIRTKQEFPTVVSRALGVRNSTTPDRRCRLDEPRRLSKSYLIPSSVSNNEITILIQESVSRYKVYTKIQWKTWEHVYLRL